MALKIRRPAVAGTFYPETPEKLSALVDEYLENAQTPKTGEHLIALISPHAGFTYSGMVAAEGYNQLSGLSFDKVIIAAPSHREPISGGSIYDGDAYNTPLGDISIDRILAEKIVGLSQHIRFSDVGHTDEHSLEVQLPFLQRTLKNDFSLVPLIMGSIDMQTADEIADALATALVNENALLIASTDLSHFHDKESAFKLDHHAAELLEQFNIAGLFSAAERHECEACGIYPLTVILKTAQKLGAKEVKVLKYATSGDITGDYSGVVGYLSAVLTA